MSIVEDLWTFGELFLSESFQCLQSDQLDTRLKAVGLVGDLFALPGSTISEAFQPIFSEFLKRLTDRVVTVRMSVLEYVKSCLLSNASKAEAPQIICKCIECSTSLFVFCSILTFSWVKFSSCTLWPSIGLWWQSKKASRCCYLWRGMSWFKFHSTGNCETCCWTSSRQICKYSFCNSSLLILTIPCWLFILLIFAHPHFQLLVKKYTMERLVEIYRVYCVKYADGSIKTNEFDWIPGKILRCYYDKDFR